LLAVFRGIEDRRRVQPVRQADHHRVDPASGHAVHFIPVVKFRGRAAELLAAIFQVFGGDIAQRDTFHFVAMLQDAFDVRAGDSSGADDCETDFRGSCHG